MITKEECEKAFKMLNSLITHSPFKDDPRDYNDLKINNSRLQNEYMDAVMLLKFLIDEHFTPNALTFEDLINIWCKNKRLIIYDKNNKVPLEVMFVIPQNETFRCFVGGAKNLIKFKFEKNRYYLIQIPEVDI